MLCYNLYSVQLECGYFLFKIHIDQYVLLLDENAGQFCQYYFVQQISFIIQKRGQHEILIDSRSWFGHGQTSAFFLTIKKKATNFNICTR